MIVGIMLKDQNGRFSDETLVFELGQQVSLRRNIEDGKEQYLRLLEYRIRRNPQDLLCHAQRIFQYLEPDSREPLLGALTDLYIALGEHGRAFRARMLATARPYISDSEYQYFSHFLKRGIHPCQARYSRHSSLTASYERNNLHAGCGDLETGESTADPVQEAIRLAGEGHIERAEAVLTEELERSPMNVAAERALHSLLRRKGNTETREPKGKRLQGARSRLSGKWGLVKDAFHQPIHPPVFGDGK